MELLAPAGTLGCLKAAVNSGADAVYFAGKNFGARSYAGNFSDDEIFAAADYCHLRNARAYVTVNTMTFDREFKELEKLIYTLTMAGIDGVIVQDLGVLRFIREISPDIELHGSTQMTVHSADGVKELEKLGVSRVVLSRELTGAEIGDIIKNVNAEIEVFVHGAMCMSYSGQCLMSSVIGGRSGNRGKCAQPCRLTFSPDGKKPRHYLSLKDMSYASHIAEMEDMGVASLKIEGRMKGEEYVSKVVSIYRGLIDERRIPTDYEKNRLEKVFFRGGLSDGYYTGKNGKNMFAFDKPDNPYLKNDEEAKLPENKQIDTELSAYLFVGEMPKLTLKCNGEEVTVSGDKPIENAEKRAATVTGVIEQLSKTGGTAFNIIDYNIELSDNAFIPVSVLNELRRDGIAALNNKILDKFKDKRFKNYSKKVREQKTKIDGGFTCSVLNVEQYRAVKDYELKLIYIPLHIVEENLDELLLDKERIVITPPVILRKADRHKYKNRMCILKEFGFDKAEIHTIDTIGICDGFKLYGGQRLNIANSLSAEEYADMQFKSLCLSAELNIAQMSDISAYIDKEAIVYGKIPLMITENCILKNMDNCPCNGIGRMVDRTGAEFTVVKDGDICRSVVLNNVPLYTADKFDKIMRINADYYRLVFTDEDEKGCKDICDAYINKKQINIWEYTRLHLFKGALM